MCSYCGDFPNTRDHVPSKILLDEPFPENLPVVPCCYKCNQGFSLDEEYFACIIECIIHGTTEIESLNRLKIKSILSKKENLRKLLDNSFIVENENKFFKIELPRVENTITKLAKGHLKFENSEPQFENPTSIVFKTILDMDDNEVEAFFTPIEVDKAPEVGSRTLQNIHFGHTQEILSHWTIVQKGTYQYMVSVSLRGEIVRILIWDYLAIEVIWSNY
ncbi:hypothetical protein [Flavobacterium covae]|nr:hypothetical protein [Flavobacterium covae]AMA49006.1 hypothetical protein AWN65_05770 [Flavobacterium covae]